MSMLNPIGICLPRSNPLNSPLLFTFLKDLNKLMKTQRNPFLASFFTCGILALSACSNQHSQSDAMTNGSPMMRMRSPAMQRQMEEKMDAYRAQQIQNAPVPAAGGTATYSQWASQNGKQVHPTDARFDEAKKDCAKLFKTGSNQYSNCVMKLME